MYILIIENFASYNNCTSVDIKLANTNQMDHRTSGDEPSYFSIDQRTSLFSVTSPLRVLYER